ncbi:hypothetical protein DKX38_015208 [Salix brachista]|uniref:Reverse transcriptase Ty1/copia-type domain-containing protein n=1 Tax=Salix brachista TaxID=2182728 RepID=A0A5N5L4J8_9ROSI|nr:hypothetical protein DKX38_015208 [Salix brachista]
MEDYDDSNDAGNEYGCREKDGADGGGVANDRNEDCFGEENSAEDVAEGAEDVADVAGCNADGAGCILNGSGANTGGTLNGANTGTVTDSADGVIAVSNIAACSALLCIIIVYICIRNQSSLSTDLAPAPLPRVDTSQNAPPSVNIDPVSPSQTHSPSPPAIDRPISPPPNNPQIEPTNHHPMTTRSKNNIHKPKFPQNTHIRLTEKLVQIGFVGSEADHSLYIYHSDSILTYILIYVDDIILAGPDLKFIHHVISLLQMDFPVKDLGTLGFFLGVEAIRRPEGLYLSQRRKEKKRKVVAASWLYMENELDDYTQDGTVDLKGKPVLRSKSGGWRACSFVVGNLSSLLDLYEFSKFTGQARVSLTTCYPTSLQIF